MSRPRSIDREAVLNAAEAIVSSQGAGALTVDSVAKAAGITKGGVQSSFGTKDNLIAAMVLRANDAYTRACADDLGVDAEAISADMRVPAYLRVMASSESLNAKAASMLAGLLQSPDQLEQVRAWYALHLDSIDTSSAAGRRLQLAFLAAEGAFMLRHFGLAKMDDSRWQQAFDDILALIPPASQAAGKARKR